jgi:hypothetical protein
MLVFTRLMIGAIPNGTLGELTPEVLVVLDVLPVPPAPHAASTTLENAIKKPSRNLSAMRRPSNATKIVP